MVEPTALPNRPPTPDLQKMTVEQLCERIEGYTFACEAGALRNNLEWIELRKRIGA